MVSRLQRKTQDTQYCDKMKAWNSNKFKEMISEIPRLSAYSLTILNDGALSTAEILAMPEETWCK